MTVVPVVSGGDDHAAGQQGHGGKRQGGKDHGGAGMASHNGISSRYWEEIDARHLNRSRRDCSSPVQVCRLVRTRERSRPERVSAKGVNLGKTAMNKVNIYRFTLYDITTDGPHQSRRWGTRDAIERIGGEILADTVIEVDASAVDSDIAGLTARDYLPHAQAA
jgi:hypothetical protein